MGSRWACAQVQGELLPHPAHHPRRLRRPGPGPGTPSCVSLMWGAAGCGQEGGRPACTLSPQTPALWAPPFPGYRRLGLCCHGALSVGLVRAVGHHSCVRGSLVVLLPHPGWLIPVPWGRLQTGLQGCAPHCLPPPAHRLRASLDLPHLPCHLHSQNPGCPGTPAPGEHRRGQSERQRLSRTPRKGGDGGFSSPDSVWPTPHWAQLALLCAWGPPAPCPSTAETSRRRPMFQTWQLPIAPGGCVRGTPHLPVGAALGGERQHGALECSPVLLGRCVSHAVSVSLGETPAVAVGQRHSCALVSPSSARVGSVAVPAHTEQPEGPSRWDRWCASGQAHGGYGDCCGGGEGVRSRGG